MIELAMSPTIRGSSPRPEFVGEKPWTICSQRGRNTIAPKKANAAKNTATIVAE